jgi:hypothetical protein
LTSYATA